MAYTDLLKTSNFIIQTRDSNHMEFFCQEVQIPGFQIGNLDIGHQAMKDKRPGDSVEWEDLTLTILCDEDLNAFKDVYKYLNLTHDPYTNTLEVRQEVFDATLFITSNKNNPKFKIKFYDAWFQSVSPIQFQSTSPDENNLTFTVGIRYNYYLLEPMTI
jgi:hypothetical protein